MSGPSAGESSPSLRRTLGTTDLTLLVVGNVIGSGIFIVPSAVLREAGSVPMAMAVWVVGGVLSLFGALSYAELGAMDRGSGGLYSYVRDAFGRFPAFLLGWTFFFGIGGGTVAALAVAITSYLGQFVVLAPVAQKGIAVALIAAMAAIAFPGIRRSATVQNWGTLVKFVALLVMSVILLAGGQGGAPLPAADHAGPGALLSAAGVAMLSVLWAYEGWQYVTFATGEAADPARSMPRAIGLGTLLIIGIYLLANVGYLAALGPAGVAASERVAGDAMTAVLGPWAGRAIAAAIIVSMWSAALATVITLPRASYTMARDGAFFAALAKVHPTHQTPAVAIVATCAWAAALALSGTFEQLLAYVVFVGWIFYALAAAAVIVLRRKRPDAERPYRVPGYPVTPLLFVLAAVALVANTIVTQPRFAALGLGMVALGAPAYLVWRRGDR
ncbi:MAG: amino acid permease [Gemmatimonadaceae bacterium]|nr:amino acid permease [Gemmatimonadaceae bacterium]